MEKIICEERSDEGLRTFKDNICGTIRSEKESGGDKRVIEVNRLGNIYGEDKGTGFAGNVWDDKGLCPTITTMQGGNREPMIVEDFYKNRELRVYEETAPTIRAEREGLKVIEENLLDVYNNKMRDDECCGTLTTNGNTSFRKCGTFGVIESTIVASRGRNPDNPSDRKQGIELEQRLEPNSEGICNTLTSVQKDNLLLTPNNWKHKAGDGTKTRSRRISEIHPALQANTGASQQTYLAETPYRIRKLTPKECAKLMKFSDEDANKMLEVNSNTQVYKQCGNSIVVSVLEAIFCQMNIKGCPTWEERAKEEYL